jgi:moderate conductance mechanosensitive channel
MKRKHGLLALLMTILVVLMPLDRSVLAQLPIIPNFSNQSSNSIVSACIRLDGRCVVEVAASQSDLSSRVTEIEQRLNDFARYFYQTKSSELNVYQEGAGSLIDIHVAIDDRDIRLLSVTSQDAALKAIRLEQRSLQMVREIRNSLTQAKREREASFLIAQVQHGAIALLLLIFATIVLYYFERKASQQKETLHASLENTSAEQAISTQITQNQRQQLAEIKYRGLQITRFGLWLGMTFYLVGLFPHTRFLQIWMRNFLRIPFRLFIVGLGVYFLTRFSFILIDKFTSVLANNYLLTPEANLRLQLRISTISSVTKSIVVVTWIVVGILVGLSAIEIGRAHV